MSLFWMFVLAFVANGLYLGLLYAIQEFGESVDLPTRYSFVPGTNQRFLYLQDFHTTTWGDAIGIPLMLVAFIWLVANGFFSTWHWMSLIIFSLIVAASFITSCLGGKHKPDIGYPEIGKISRTGIAHLPYLGFNVVINIYSLLGLMAGFLPTEIIAIWIVGLVIYALSFYRDIKDGNFAPLKKV